MTPSKAGFHRRNIPDKYAALSDPNVVSGQDYFAELLEVLIIALPIGISFYRQDHVLCD